MRKEYLESRYKTAHKHKTLIVLFIAIGLMLLGLAVVMSIRISSITVTGNSWYTEDEIVDMLFDEKWDYNTAYCYYKYQTKEHESIPFIQDYKIIFQGVDKVEIVIYEKSLIGCIKYMDSYMYFDKDGIIVESSKERFLGIPVISGFHFNQVILYQPLPTENKQIFTDILNLTQMLTSNEIDVEKIYFDEDMNITLHMGNVKVYLGDSKQLIGKILKLKEIKPNLEGLSGTLSLDSYSEDNDKLYSFKRKE